jgi:hypothetical protein
MSDKITIIRSNRKKDNRKFTTIILFPEQEIRINSSGILNCFKSTFQFLESKKYRNYKNKGLFCDRKIKSIKMRKVNELFSVHECEIKN